MVEVIVKARLITLATANGKINGNISDKTRVETFEATEPTVYKYMDKKRRGNKLSQYHIIVIPVLESGTRIRTMLIYLLLQRPTSPSSSSTSSTSKKPASSVRDEA